MKNKDSHIDRLGDSHLPADLLTPTSGSTFLLGVDTPLDYGLGVLEGVLDPEYMPPPALPTGLSQEASERVDLGAMLSSDSEMDLSWMDPDSSEWVSDDPHEVMAELEELWGSADSSVKVQTNSVDLSKLQYEESLREPTPIKQSSERTYVSVIAHAMRRSAMGQDINTVVNETLESVGEDYERYIPAMKLIKAEHGLNGVVFIRRSAFPNFDSGKWKDHIKKYHSNAKYIVVAKEDFNKTNIVDGRCTYTGKQAVLEVDWDDAWNYYAPRLKSTGHKLATGDKRESLRRALLNGPEQVQVESNLPVQVNPADTITRESALEQFDAYTPERKVYDPEPARLAEMHKAVETKLQQLVRDYGLPQKEASAILSSDAHPQDKLRTASQIVTRVKQGSYSGYEKGLESLISLKKMTGQRELEASFRFIEEMERRHKEATLENKQNQSSTETIEKLVEKELISRFAADKILGSNVTWNDKVKMATDLAISVKVSEYSGLEGGLEGLVHLRRKLGQAELESSKRFAQEVDKRTLQSIHDLVKQGLISKGAANTILSSNASLTEKARIASELAYSVKKSDYDGLNQYAGIQSERGLTQVRDLSANQKEIEQRVQQREFLSSEEGKIATEVNKLASQIENEISRGITGDTLKSFVQRTVPKSRMPQVLAKVKDVLLPALKNKTAKTAQYEGVVFTAEKAETQQRGVLAGNIRKASQWLRRTLSEGFAGKDLDSLLQNKFSEALLTAAQDQFTEIRNKHEGASGFIYVDAEAYASEAGSKGCEESAPKHRANGIPAVAAMSRCATCVHNKTLEDGTPRCGVFNKTLLFDAEVPEHLKQKNIQTKEMTDAEITASMFSSTGGATYDPTEFGLKNSNLEDVGFEDMPETEKISKILFDGWDID